jgi:hypothetical protein
MCAFQYLCLMVQAAGKVRYAGWIGPGEYALCGDDVFGLDGGNVAPTHPGKIESPSITQNKLLLMTMSCGVRQEPKTFDSLFNECKRVIECAEVSVAIRHETQEFGPGNILLMRAGNLTEERFCMDVRAECCLKITGIERRISGNQKRLRGLTAQVQLISLKKISHGTRQIYSRFVKSARIAIMLPLPLP